MIIRSAVLSAMLCNSVVARISEFTTSLKSGKNLMSNSRRLDGEDDLSWMTDYSIIFEGCHSIVTFDQEDGGGEEDESKVSYQNLAKFRLCPSGHCSTSCSKGGQYMTDMNQFMQTYLEYQEEMKEAACQTVAENCDCENANDDEVCEQQCYTDAGLDYCIEEEDENDDKYEDFDIQEFMECRQIDDGGDDDSVSYYVGPKCASNGKSIYLQVFTNERCTVEASSGDNVFQGIYGQSMPYTKQSIIGSDCISCLQEGENDDDDNVEVNEICNQVYEEAAKCETYLDIDNPSTQDCSFMKSSVKNVQYSKSYTAKTFSCTFAMTTLLLGYYAFTLRKKLERSDVKLNEDIVGEMS